MLLLFLICVTFAAVNEVVANECKTCLMVDGQCHNSIHVLDFDAQFQKNVIITELAIHDNTAYFAFQPPIDDLEYYKVGYVNLVSPVNHGVLAGQVAVSNFRTFDFDEAGQMYLGGGDGVSIAPGGQNPRYFSSRSDTILKIFFLKKLYFVRVDENIIIEKDGEIFKPHQEYKKVKNFAFGKNNILVFLNNTGLYASKWGTSDTVKLSINAFFRGLTTRNKEDVYAWWIDGIYKIVIDETKFTNSKLVKVADIPSIGAMAIDKDKKLWFTSGKGLYRLDPVDKKEC